MKILKFENKLLRASSGALIKTGARIRVKIKANAQIPNNRYGTAVEVDNANKIWDIFTEGNSWDGLFYQGNIIEVIDTDSVNITSMVGIFDQCTLLATVNAFDTRNVTIMSGMFASCYALKHAPLLNTSNATNINDMFFNCQQLKEIPLFDTSKVINCDRAFYNCYNVESGALSLYNQMSSQTVPPEDHAYTFLNCGRDTQTGAAELAQIPEDWK